MEASHLRSAIEFGMPSSVLLLRMLQAEAFHWVRHLVEQTWKRCGVGDRRIGKLHGQ